MAKRRTDAAAGKCVLHVHAEGAQNIHASDSRFSLDAKPDPYVVFVLDDVTHKCDHVNDVEPIKYFTWPNAVKGFEIVQERTLTDSSLIVHVKDSDTIKDRYIGGTAIPLGPLYAAMQNNVLCQSKMFTLEFADEKFKKKKDSGESLRHSHQLELRFPLRRSRLSKPRQLKQKRWRSQTTLSSSKRHLI
ncbi:hypothetical protein Gpo141_00002491 [Globisporangium polare]